MHSYRSPCYDTTKFVTTCKLKAVKWPRKKQQDRPRNTEEFQTRTERRQDTPIVRLQDEETAGHVVRPPTDGTLGTGRASYHYPHRRSLLIRLILSVMYRLLMNAYTTIFDLTGSGPRCHAMDMLMINDCRHSSFAICQLRIRTMLQYARVSTAACVWKIFISCPFVYFHSRLLYTFAFTCQSDDHKIHLGATATSTLT